MEFEPDMEKAAENNKVLREILSELSHSIRTPLNSILGFSTALLETERPEQEKEYLLAIKESGENILKLFEEKFSVKTLNSLPDTDLLSGDANKSGINFHEIKKLRILQVEDDLLNIKLVKLLFQEFGMNAEVAIDGKEAVEKISKSNYDLVLMDIEMPEMDGYETTHHIRQVLKMDIPIIALTAHALQGEREKCMEAGMNGYISKPINSILLFELIYKMAGLISGMNRQSVEKIINLDYLFNIMHGNKKSVFEMMGYFNTQLPIYLNEIENAIEKNDYLQTSRMAHKIKAAVSIMHIKPLDPLLKEIEDLGNQGGNMKKIKSLYDEVRHLTLQAIEEIECELNENFNA